MPTILALLAVTVFFALVIGIQIYRALLGRVVIETEAGPFNPGDAIRGHVIIEARKALEVKNVSLVFECIDTRHNGENDTHYTRYRQITEMPCNESLSWGNTINLDFEITIPEQVETQGIQIQLPELAEDLLKPLANLAQKKREKDIYWRLVATVHSDRIELYGDKVVDVKLMI